MFDADGRQIAERFLGCLPRDSIWRWISTICSATARQGHAELVYDFRDGGEADGWMHALVRYEDRRSGHVAETSFGAHIFNTAMTYKDEPQSYSGPPPGLSTRLFLKLGDRAPPELRGADLRRVRALACRARDDAAAARQRGEVIAEAAGLDRVLGLGDRVAARAFQRRLLEAAGPTGYVLIRDTTCRLFGYHGLMDEAGGFSLDHMFGF